MGSAKAARTIPVSVAVLRPPGVSAELLLPAVDAVLDGRLAVLGRYGQGSEAALDHAQQRAAALFGEE